MSIRRLTQTMMAAGAFILSAQFLVLSAQYVAKARVNSDLMMNEIETILDGVEKQYSLDMTPQTGVSLDKASAELSKMRRRWHGPFDYNRKRAENLTRRLSNEYSRARLTFKEGLK